MMFVYIDCNDVYYQLCPENGANMQILAPFLLLLAPCKNNSHVLVHKISREKLKCNSCCETQSFSMQLSACLIKEWCILSIIPTVLRIFSTLHTFHISNLIKNKQRSKLSRPAASTTEGHSALFREWMWRRISFLAKFFIFGEIQKFSSVNQDSVRLILQHFQTPHFGYSCGDCILIVVEIELQNIHLYSCNRSDHVCFFFAKFQQTNDRRVNVN